jgi:hypothetical protein
MNLPIPPEPEKLQGAERETPNWIRGRLLSWDSKQITSYLWHAWKKELEKYGVTWPKFETFLARYEAHSPLINWAQQKISWEECINEIKQKLNKALEQEQRKRKEKPF